MTIQVDFYFVSMDSTITQESFTTDNFSAGNINYCISYLQDTGEESFKCIASISEAIIIPPTQRPTKGPPTSSPVLSKDPTKDTRYITFNTLITKPSTQRIIIPTIFLSPKPSLL